MIGRSTARPGSRARHVRNATWYVLLSLLSLLVLFPVWMILMRALSQPISYLSAGQPARPVDPEWDVFARAFTEGDLGRKMGISAVVTVIIATAQVVTSVGGQVRLLDQPEQLDATVRQLPCMADARQIVCTVPGLHVANLELDRVEDPHQLAGVDVAILPGDFAVAENGAVWVSDRGMRHRVIYFLTQHLVLVTPRSELIDHMHQAYERLEFKDAGYGLFISGPSKTADIEQSLVIGAHGPRSLTVILV